MDAYLLNEPEIWRERYRPLLGHVLPAGMSCALTTASGALVWRDKSFPARLVATPPRRGAAAGNRPGAGLFHAPVLDEDGERAALLWAHGPAGDAERVIEGLASVAACLSRELALQSELDSMTSELTERYEELNLVYNTEDQVSYFAEGQAALVALVGNCREFLNVSLAALIMRDRRCEIHDGAPDMEPEGVAGLLEHLSTQVYDAVCSERQPLVLNQPRSAESRKFIGDLPYRVMAMPILDQESDAIGILAIVNSERHARFSNGDKNLIRVMALKASKIVQVSFDPLTGLINREGFEFLVGQLRATAQNSAVEHAVIHLDIDQLHVLNDSVSRAAGDHVLKEVANIVVAAVRDSDIVSRFGADEFGVLLRDCANARAVAIAKDVCDGVAAHPIRWDDRLLRVTMSGGVVPLDARTESAAAALTAAELACDTAKELGIGRVQQYVHEDAELLKRQGELDAIGKIRGALENDELVLYGQIIKPLHGEESRLHLEILVRMLSKKAGLVLPQEFIGAAERYHLMPEIDRWIVEHALDYLSANWTSLESQLEMVAINLSGQSVSETSFAAFVDELLDRIAVPPDRICFEITETAVVRNLEQAREFIGRLTRRGCRFALDDFGSGMSSFGYLRSLPVHYLKIDGSLVKEIGSDPVSASMVAAAHQVATVMGLKTIGEYVQSAAVCNELRRIGIDFGQGFFIAEPKPLAEHFTIAPELHGAAAS